METMQVVTQQQSQMINMTREIQQIVSASGVINGVCTVFVPHTTAGVTINENADPDVVHDILKTLNKMVPWEDNYRHGEGNSAAHIKASMMGFSQTVLVEGGRLVLGTWQSLYFCEFDGPRQRKVYISVGAL
jgi:secondary thiamine-phosphate synthase enzyme